MSYDITCFIQQNMLFSLATMEIEPLRKGSQLVWTKFFFTARYDLFNFKKRGRAEYLWSLLNGGMKIHKIKFFFVWLKIRGWITPPKSWSSLGTCSQPGNPEEHIIKYQSDNFQFFFFEEYFELNPKARLPLLINVSLKADGRTPSGQSSLVTMQQGCPMNGPMNRAMNRAILQNAPLAFSGETY